MAKTAKPYTSAAPSAGATKPDDAATPPAGDAAQNAGLPEAVAEAAAGKAGAGDVNNPPKVATAAPATTAAAAGGLEAPVEAMALAAADDVVAPAPSALVGFRLRVRALQPSRWRIGRQFGLEPVEIVTADLTEAQIMALMQDTLLAVDVV